MTCRRKLKRERELVADINKAFSNFCSGRYCSRDGCELYGPGDCKLRYILNLLKMEVSEDDEQANL